MRESRDHWLALLLSIAVALLTLVPYWLASHLIQPGEVFSGFLLNPTDGFSYLAKMQQGREGWWTFVLPYAADPGARVFLFTYHVLLGHIAGWIDVSNLAIYHAARLFTSILMFYSAYFLYKCILPTRRLVWFAFALTAIGSGLGWLGALFGIMSTDLWVPEAIPFLTAYTNAHFPLVAALMLIVARMFIDHELGRFLRNLVSLLCGLMLAMIQPIAVVSILVIFACWLLVEIYVSWRVSGRLDDEENKNSWLTLLMFLIGSIPVLLYEIFLTQSHPAITIWNQQNLTPSPAIYEVLIGFGILLVLAVMGAVAYRLHNSCKGRLLITWVVLSAILIYIPYPLQRRFLMGFFFPLACLAAYGIQALLSRGISFKALVAAVFILAIPSNLFVVAAGLSSVQKSEELLVLTESEEQAYEWMADNLPEGSLLLIGPRGGNRLPAYSNLRVLYGHPFETPLADQQLETIKGLYSQDLPEASALEQVKRIGIDYIFVGPEESEFADPGWLQSYSIVYEDSGISIYKVP